VLAGALLAEADNALSPNSSLVIADGASVILDFGGAGGTSLPGFAAPTPALAIAVAPTLAPAGIAAVPEPGTGALAGWPAKRRGHAASSEIRSRGVTGVQNF
jgi:hypothetical protein